MATEFIVIGLIFIISGFAVFFLSKLEAKHNQTNITMDLSQVESQIKAIPGRVLNSITSSSNSHKGSLGELIGYIKLNASYDRIIPLGSIVDFVAIEFPSEEKPGRIVFVDIKTGKAKLSKEQLMLQNLIKDKKIEFKKISIDINDCIDSSNEITR